jgi:hypothetical protein
VCCNTRRSPPPGLMVKLREGAAAISPQFPCSGGPRRHLIYVLRATRQFWSYCGLGIMMRVSSEWEKQGAHWVRAQVKSTRGLTCAFNHTLKYVFKGAATTVITKLKGHPLEQHFQRQLAAGTKPNLAKLTLARKIAATALAMWKNQEAYDSERHRTA